MIESLYAIDISLFVLLNQTLTFGILDVVMPVITDLNHQIAFRVIVIGLTILALWKGGARGRYLVLVLLVAVTASDQVNSFLVKEWIGRLRPCQELFDVRLLVDCGGGKSFPSSHAVNAGTIAMVVSFFYPRVWTGMATFALLVGYSRIYVGVHYPSDVATGLVLGAMWGWLTSASILAAGHWLRHKTASIRRRHHERL